MATPSKRTPARGGAKLAVKSKVREKERPTEKTIPAAFTDTAWLASVRETLLQRRTALTNVVQSNREQLASNEGDPADIADRASNGFEDELTAGLLSLEANQLEEIDAALQRVDRGTYGICLTCEKPIPRKRLEILPFAKRCLKCEGDKERASKLYGPKGDEEEEAVSTPEEEEPEAD